MSKKILITGSTDGIGRLAAIKLAKAGNQMHLHGRSEQKLNALIKDVKKEVDSSNVFGYVADFSDLESVAKMAEEVSAATSELDVLLNNAGVFQSPITTAKNGLDIRITVNYLAPYILTEKLLPLLEKSDQPRIINLGSAAQAPVNLMNLQENTNLSDQEAYAQSKLAITMWTFHLAKANPNIASIVVNPGSLLDTKMAKDAYGQVWSPATKGSDILFDLASIDDYQNYSGEYFDNDKGHFGQAHPDAYNQEKIARLLEATKKAI